MRKIALNLDDIRDIVSESVFKAIQEINRPDVNDINITNIDYNILKKIVIDYRLIPTSTSYGDELSMGGLLKEAYGHSVPPDEAMLKLSNKYSIPSALFKKVEHHHNIYVYLITCLIGENDKLIEDDMDKLGYYLSNVGDTVFVNGNKFHVLQFEPYSQYQEDETENIIKNNEYLYHWTPEYALNDILKNGLIPDCKNDLLKFPPRVYLILDNVTDDYKDILGYQLFTHNKNPNNDGNYILLKIDISKLNNDNKFYYDPNSSIGIYTEDKINIEAIEPIKKLNFKNFGKYGKY